MTIQVEKTKLSNTDQNRKYGNSAFDTFDSLFLESYEEIKEAVQEFKSRGYSEEEIFLALRFSASDYARAAGSLITANGYQTVDGKLTSWGFQRSAGSRISVSKTNTAGDPDYYDSAYITSGGACPALNSNRQSLISARSASQPQAVKSKSGKVLYYVVESGQFPQSYVGEKLNKELEKQFQKTKIKKTGKTYSGKLENGRIVNNDEYEYNGKRYVRKLSTRHYSDTQYKFVDGSRIPDGEIVWMEVEPVKYKIWPWDIEKFKQGQNVRMRTESAILSGIPFYPEYGDERGRDTMWQNSALRAVLNGYDLHKEIDRGNGNKEYKNDQNFNCENNGLLQQMFDKRTLERLEQQTVIAEPQLDLYYEYVKECDKARRELEEEFEEFMKSEGLTKFEGYEIFEEMEEADDYEK